MSMRFSNSEKDQRLSTAILEGERKRAGYTSEDKMKTEYKYIHFKMEPMGDVEIWNCYNTRHGDLLGSATWYTSWRQWVYTSIQGIVYSSECLADIKHFIDQMNERGKGEKQSDG